MKNVLFVCLGNSCRSQMAEAFARKYGPHVLNSASAGLSSAQSIARDTSEVMREKGIELTDQFPKDYEPALAERYDVVVNLSGYELPPLKRPLLVEWIVKDPLGESRGVHRQIRDEVEQRIRNLIAEIEQGKPIASDTSRHLPVGQRIAPIVVRKPGLWQRFTRLL